MANIDKTVFISYRRKDISWALAVYHYLTKNDYDVFFDFTSIPSGDFEQNIISNIKARAHFLVILTPSALDRCYEPEDWLRREIETALSEKRNIIPLFFDNFSFDEPSVSKVLTGRLASLKKYNGVDVPVSYFDAAMERMCERYLNVALEAVLHPVSDEVRKVTKEQQNAADEAIKQQIDDLSSNSGLFNDFFKAIFGLDYTKTSEARHKRDQIYNQSLSISLEESAIGTIKQIQTLNGDLSVKIPPGVRSKSKIRLAGAGPNGSDFYLLITVTPHPIFTKTNLDLHIRYPISEALARIGGDIKVPIIGGKGAYY